jgi:tryptophan-rich sensory protein
VSDYLSLIVFLAICVGGGLVIGSATAPGEWYAGLAKPSFNPPNWLFGPTWTILYILIAIAGWLVWRHDPHGVPFYLWTLQLLLNFLWSPVFFAARQIGWALFVILALLLTILAFIVVTWPASPIAAMLFLPYAAWVAFASILNASVWRLN